ncbi:MAG TPA: BsuPI-related putative proteinase inhibitor [Gemmatimonadales bacterium]|jgi:hypothetical protein
MPFSTAVTLALLAAACAADWPEHAADARAADLAERTMTASVPDSVFLRLIVPGEVRAGQPVPLGLRIEHRGTRPLDLYLRGRAITVDIEVARADGEVVWRRLEGQIIPAILHIRTLAPGERLEVDVEWDQRTTGGAPVAPGAYVARALLLAEGDPWATEWVGFRIGG